MSGVSIPCAPLFSPPSSSSSHQGLGKLLPLMLTNVENCGGSGPKPEDLQNLDNLIKGLVQGKLGIDLSDATNEQLMAIVSQVLSDCREEACGRAKGLRTTISCAVIRDLISASLSSEEMALQAMCHIVKTQKDRVKSIIQSKVTDPALQKALLADADGLEACLCQTPTAPPSGRPSADPSTGSSYRNWVWLYAIAACGVIGVVAVVLLVQLIVWLSRRQLLPWGASFSVALAVGILWVFFCMADPLCWFHYCKLSDPLRYVPGVYAGSKTLAGVRVGASVNLEEGGKAQLLSLECSGHGCPAGDLMKQPECGASIAISPDNTARGFLLTGPCITAIKGLETPSFLNDVWIRQDGQALRLVLSLSVDLLGARTTIELPVRLEREKN